MIDRQRFLIVTACAVLSVSPVAHAAITDPLTDLTDLALWLDASDASTVSLSGTSVTGWTDKVSSTTYTSAGANTPTYLTADQNGLNALTFDGMNDSIGTGFVAGIANTFDVFIVAKPMGSVESETESRTGAAALSGQRWLWAPDYVDGTVRGAGLSVGTDGATVGEHTASTFAPVATATGDTRPGDTYAVYHVRYDDKTPSIYINGELFHTSAQTDPVKDILASTQFGSVGPSGGPSGYGSYAGRFGEVMVLDGNLSSGDVDMVNQYLADKWDIDLDPAPSVMLSTEVLGYGTFADGYSDGAVEIVRRIANTDAAPVPVAYTADGGGPTIDLSEYITSGATAGLLGSNEHGRGGNLAFAGDLNVLQEGIGGHANWIVTFDLDQIRDDFFGGDFTSDLLLTGEFGTWLGIATGASNGILQGAIFLDGVRIDSMGEVANIAEETELISLTLDAGAQYLTFAILNDSGDSTGNQSSYDDGIFQNLLLTTVENNIIPTPAALPAGLTLLGLAVVRRRRPHRI